MVKDTYPSRIRFINGDDDSEISATCIRVVLPNNFSFEIDSDPGRGGAAVFTFSPGFRDDSTFRYFSIEPGASNLFSVNVDEAIRCTETQDVSALTT